MQLKITKRTVDGILAIGCSGRIVFGEESSLLRDEVKKVIADGNKRIVLNLSQISYIDSGGLGTLVALHTTAHNTGGTIKLANLTPRVGDLLQVTKLLTVFEVHDSEYDAFNAMAADPSGAVFGVGWKSPSLGYFAFTERYDGSAWKIEPTPDFGPPNSNLYGVVMTSATRQAVLLCPRPI